MRDEEIWIRVMLLAVWAACVNLWLQRHISVDGPAARLLLVTNPFGRDLRLAVQGFVSRAITLYPLTGLSIDPKADLEPLPTLLLRPSIDALASLKDGGACKVFRVITVGCLPLGETANRETGIAFMVGTLHAVVLCGRLLPVWEPASTSYNYRYDSELELGKAIASIKNQLSRSSTKKVVCKNYFR